MIIENKGMGIRFEVDNQQDFDKWYATRKEQIRADAIDEMVNALGTEPFSAYVMEIIRHWAKKLKEQKK